jgi:hypothetical protein
MQNKILIFFFYESSAEGQKYCNRDEVQVSRTPFIKNLLASANLCSVCVFVFLGGKTGFPAKELFSVHPANCLPRCISGTVNGLVRYVTGTRELRGKVRNESEDLIPYFLFGP